jgi:hypothetical protein
MPVHRPRLALLLALAGSIAVLVPGVGTGSSTAGPKRTGDQCTTLVFQNELQVVFGRVRTSAAAQVLLGRVRRVGFTNADIIRTACGEYKVFQRGVETWDVGVELQAEARSVGIASTLECVRGKGAGDIQAIVGTRPTQADIDALAQKARAGGITSFKIRPAPCGGYQLYVTGFRTKAQAIEFRDNARRSGFPETIVVVND